MLDLRVAFEADEFGNVHAAKFAYAAEIVAHKVGDHDEFGHFLGAGLEFVGELRVARGIGIARARAFDRTRLNMRAAQIEKTLGRTAGELKIAGIQESGEGSGRRFEK